MIKCWSIMIEILIEPKIKKQNYNCNSILYNVHMGGKIKLTVSVIIPTYNREHLVGRAIQSVLQQTYRDFELMVIIYEIYELNLRILVIREYNSSINFGTTSNIIYIG